MQGFQVVTWTDLSVRLREAVEARPRAMLVFYHVVPFVVNGRGTQPPPTRYTWSGTGMDMIMVHPRLGGN